MNVRPARKNVLLDLTITFLRYVLQRLELRRMARIRAPELLTAEDVWEFAYDYLDDWNDGDVITAGREADSD